MTREDIQRARVDVVLQILRDAMEDANTADRTYASWLDLLVKEYAATMMGALLAFDQAEDPDVLALTRLCEDHVQPR